jgi:hypothetical protein
MTSPHGRRLQTRRALAIMTWATLTLCAWLLWYGQRYEVIRIQAWEPAALVLSAYVTFLSIFGWMLFSPGNRSPEESPALFFSGMLTLIPPCYIAYNLMPDNSPLRPWLTIGVFLFGVLAIMSPLPKEVFAVPRDRRSYLQPLTDAYLSELNTEPPEIRFDELLPKTRFWLTQPEEEPRQREAGRDPWEDPFYGTGRQMSRVGVSQSRRNESSSDMPLLAGVAYGQDRGTRQEPARLQESRFDSYRSEPTQTRPSDVPPRGPSITIPNTGSRRPLTEPGQNRTAPVPGMMPVNVPSVPVPMPLPPARPVAPTADLNRSTGYSARDLTPPPLLSTAPVTQRSAPQGSPSSGPTGSGSMGFQAPSQPGARSDSRPITDPQSRATSFPPLKSPDTPSTNAPPLSAPSSVRPLSSDTIATLASGMLGGAAMTSSAAAANAAAAPVVARVTESARPLLDPLESRAAEVRAIVESVQRTEQPISPLMDQSFPPIPSKATSSPSLQELDRQLRELEAEEQAEQAADPPPTHRATPARMSQSNGDITMERISDEHGGEMIEGTIKVFFEVGQKRAHLHVPFSPPLGGQPEVECEPAHDDGVRVKVAVRQPYGIRIEARRTVSEEALRSEVSFAAVYTKK